MKMILVSEREGCGEGDTTAPNGAADNGAVVQGLPPIPRKPVGLWDGDGLVAGVQQQDVAIGWQRPTGVHESFDEPHGCVWPWLNPAAVRTHNVAPRRLAVAAWIDLEMSLAAAIYQTDGTEMAKAALSALAGVTPSSIPDGLWDAGSRQGARDVVVAWWRYLTFRWEAFGEWPDPTTQLAQLHLLASWRDAHGCIRQSIAGSYKGVYPLRKDLDADLYDAKAPVIVSASRELRAPHHDGATVRDTVRAYTLRPDWQEHCRRIMGLEPL